MKNLIVLFFAVIIASCSYKTTTTYTTDSLGRTIKTIKREPVETGTYIQTTPIIQYDYYRPFYSYPYYRPYYYRPYYYRPTPRPIPYRPQTQPREFHHH